MPTPPSLVQRVGFWSATSIIVGSIIGAGVFMKPSTMAAQLGSPLWLTAVWIIAGIFSLMGGLIFAELGAAIPETGGIYVYFRRIFGEFIAFLFGWSAFSVINTAAVAAISFVCAQYADYFLHLPRFSAAAEAIALHIPFIGDLHPLENAGVKFLAVLLVVVLSGLNVVNAKAGNIFQVVSTFLKMALIAALILGLFLSPQGNFQHFTQAEYPKTGWALISGIVVAMTGAFYAYDGWINVTYVAGEIKQPQKNIPASLVAGLLACIVIYVLVVQAYLYVLPVEKVAASSLVASDAITAAWGKTSGAVMAALIVICTLGAVNGNIMSTARITYAMGKDGVFLPWSGHIHRRYNTPGNALWLHMVWTSMFIITGSFDMLADMFVFITWIAYGLGAVGIFILRKKMGEKSLPYKTWGYPFIPLLFIAFSGFYLFTTIWSDVSNYLAHRQPVINSVLGLVITACGIPLYYYYKNRKRED